MGLSAMFHRLPIVALIAAVLAIAAPTAPRADDGAHAGGGDYDNDSDHDRARDLLEHGEINPLREIIARLSGEYPGDVVGISLVQAHERWIYRFKVLTRDGKLEEVSVDAKSMDVIHEEGAD
jgi:uncharacterized membrane protein YkoI